MAAYELNITQVNDIFMKECERLKVVWHLTSSRMTYRAEAPFTGRIEFLINGQLNEYVRYSAQRYEIVKSTDILHVVTFIGIDQLSRIAETEEDLIKFIHHIVWNLCEKLVANLIKASDAKENKNVK